MLGKDDRVFIWSLVLDRSALVVGTSVHAHASEIVHRTRRFYGCLSFSPVHEDFTFVALTSHSPDPTPTILDG